MNIVQSIQLNGHPVAVIDNAVLLDCHKTGLLCSRKCPADEIKAVTERAAAAASEMDSAFARWTELDGLK